MYSLDLNHRFRVKIAVQTETTMVPSIWDLWGVANWMEREVYDLFGVRFTDHPNLRRILCHDDFKGHALRKDYPINKRQQLSRPVENLLTDRPEWA
jgi:NADH:ubiquinone oxidoreductase subunit C